MVGHGQLAVDVVTEVEHCGRRFDEGRFNAEGGVWCVCILFFAVDEALSGIYTADSRFDLNANGRFAGPQ